MKVLVIGGTMFIGLETVNKLIDIGCDVTVFHRGNHNEGIPEKVKHIIGDKKELENYRDEFKKLSPDVVLDMVPFSEKTSQKIADVMNGITDRIVAISSCDVYQAYGIINRNEPEDTPIDNTPITEESNLRTVFHPYKGVFERMEEYDKILAENVYIEDSNFDATILRLPMVYGRNDYQHRLFPYLKRMQDKRPAIIINETMSNWKSCRSFVENVAEAITQTIIQDKARGQIYNVAEPYNFTEIDWIKKIQNHTGWDGKIVTVSDEVIPSGGNLKQHLAVNSDKIREHLGYKEVVELDDAINKAIEWESANPPENINPEAFNYEEEDSILKNI
jgi:nucleoside-diphosphate-sugar epimerase